MGSTTAASGHARLAEVKLGIQEMPAVNSASPPGGAAHRLTVRASRPEGCTLMAATSFLCPRIVLRHSHPPPACHTLTLPSALPESRWVGL